MITTIEEKAKKYSRDEATARGCAKNTEYWWDIKKHPTKELWAVNESNLTNDWETSNPLTP